MPDDNTQTPPVQDGESQTLEPGTGAVGPSHETPPEGSPPETDYKTKFSASTTENQRLQQENQQYQQQLQMMNMQLGQMQQAQAQQTQQFNHPAQPAESQFSEGSWLSDAEKRQLKEAYENFDTEAQMQLNQLQIKRANEQNQQTILTTLAGAATQAQGVQGVINDLQQAPELKDTSVATQVLNRAMQIQNDPYLSNRIPQVQWPIGNGMSVNPYAVERALFEVRSKAPAQAAQNQASASAYTDLGQSAPPTSAQPGSSQTFNAQMHLTESEREAIRIASVQRPKMYGSNTQVAYGNFWNKLPEAERKQRLKSGAQGRLSSGKERMVVRPTEKKE
jgi:hypothetical protein